METIASLHVRLLLTDQFANANVLLYQCLWQIKTRVCRGRRLVQYSNLPTTHAVPILVDQLV